MREIALDTETTGLDPFSGHRIVEIGCVEMINRIRTGNHFHVYLNPEREMPPEAERIHGLSATFLADKPLFRAIGDAFLEFIQDAPLVIHNAAFDMKFINAELERMGYPAISMERTIDTVLIARKKFPGQPANLDALCKRFNIDLSARTKHGALLDSELLAEVYLELHGGRQVQLGLEAQAIAEGGGESGAEQRLSGVAHRHFPASEAELAAHRVMCEKLSQPLWQKDPA